LSAGQTVYTGNVTETLPYFDQIGFPCPPQVNPADHLIDISTIDTRTPEAETDSTAKLYSLLLSWKRTQLVSPSGELLAPSTSSQMSTNSSPVSLFRQTWYLSTRSFWITIRDPLGLGGFLFEAIIIGTFVGVIFYKIPSTLTGIRTMQGFIYTILGLQGYTILLFTTWKVSVDMKLYDRERQDKMYSPLAFVLGYRLSHLVTEGMLPLELI
jgi:hypothetical protein